MPRFTASTLLILSFVLLYFTLFGRHGVAYLNSLKEETSSLEEHNRKLGSEIADLQNKLFAIQSSAPYLEKIAREQLGLSKPDDVVYLFSSPSPDARVVTDEKVQFPPQKQ